MLNPNVSAWFEIPASQLDRAQKFYEAILASIASAKLSAAATWQCFRMARSQMRAAL